ncbi:MAG: carbonic anhydrase family protein [Desulfuromonadaceae bacterium]
MKKWMILAALCLSTTAFASDGGGHAAADSGSHGGGHGGGHGAVHWGYTGDIGPAHWGDLAPEFSACKEGQSQTPINLTGLVDIDLPPINFSYGEVGVAVLNNGHTIQANYETGSSIEVEGSTYKLIQFHFHNPSENVINGQSFPIEAHLVHKSDDGKLAVVTVMFEEGAANPVIDTVWRYMPAQANADKTSNETLNVMAMLPESKDYYSFTGSLTTPPCTEGVKWMILKTPMTVSAEQILKFQRVLGMANNRPLQPLNGRVIYE